MHPSIGRQQRRLRTEQPHAIYVRIADYKETILPPVPRSAHTVLGADKACSQCQNFEGVTTTASWTFRASSTETIDVKRTQFAIAPATAKTNHPMQGSTADPGLIAHWATPSVSETSSWLSKYVLLSRVRKLSNLLSTDLPSWADFEEGPPEE